MKNFERAEENGGEKWLKKKGKGRGNREQK